MLEGRKVISCYVFGLFAFKFHFHIIPISWNSNLCLASS